MTTNQQLKAHCEDVIANPQDHSDMVLAMAKALLPCLEAEPVAWVTMQKEFCDDERTAITNQIDADRYSLNCYDLTALYAAPPVTEMKLPGISELINLSEYLPAVRDVTLWDACINEVKRLNGVTS